MGPQHVPALHAVEVLEEKKENPQPARAASTRDLVPYSKRVAPDRIMNYDPISSVIESEFIHNTPVSGPNPVFGHLLELQYEDYYVDTESLKECVVSAEKDIKVKMSDSDIPFEVQDTRNQANCMDCKLARSVRVTASVANDLLGLTSRRSQYQVLRRRLWGF